MTFGSYELASFKKNWRELADAYNKMWRFVVTEQGKPPVLKLGEDGVLYEITYEDASEAIDIEDTKKRKSKA